MSCIGKLECKKRETQLNIPVEVQLQLKCVMRVLERSIFRIGDNSVLVTGKKGSAFGELFNPRGVAVHDETHQLLNHAVSKFSLTEMCRVRWIGGKGSKKGQFNCPRQPTTDPIGRVFITDRGNDRICMHDPDLNHLRNITHMSISRPYDVKISHDRLYVLCPDSNSCMHVLTLEGDKLHSFITNGEGMNVLRPWFFCLDPLNIFVLSDRMSGSFLVLSPEGNLLHTIGREVHQFSNPTGVAITPNGRLVCVSDSEDYGLQIFY